MKGKLALCTIVVLSTLVVVGVALACEPQPPVCPAGQITVTPAVWVEGTETCPIRSFAASRTVIDVAAHTEHHHKSGGNWGLWQDGHCSGGGQCEERTIPAVTHVESFGPIPVQYGLRSSDPNHCHRPNGQDLGVPSWAMSEYNHDLPEHLDKIVTLGYWIPPVCRAPVLGCIDDTALNHNPAAEVDDGSCQYPETPIVTEEPPIETEEPLLVTWDVYGDCNRYQIDGYVNGQLSFNTQGGWDGRASVTFLFDGAEAEALYGPAPTIFYADVCQSTPEPTPVVTPPEEPTPLECPTCQCPTCDEPVQETMGESMEIAWFSDVPCTGANCVVWYQEHNPWVKLWTLIPSFYTHEGVTSPLEQILAANGETYYVVFFRDEDAIGDFSLWGPDGYGDRIRDHFPASDPNPHSYSACSIFPSWADTRLLEDGRQVALWLPGHSVSDWAQFLLQNGFFPDEEHRGTAALEWAAELRAQGLFGMLKLPPR